jgi:uncharacterized membrane protein
MSDRARRIASHGAPGLGETTLAHIYRAEVQRSTQWRVRLDITTNWSVTISAAVISYAFSNEQAPAAILLVGFFSVVLFLVIEARRYRYYDIWARRVRLIEVGYLVPLARKEPVTVDFFDALAAEFSRPRLRIGAIQSLAFRMRRTSYPLALGLLLGAWIVKLQIHPSRAQSFGEMVGRAHIGPIPGWAVMGLWLATVLFFAWLLYHGQRIPLPPTELRAPTRRRPAPLGTIFQAVRPQGIE